jgi:site-specific recombinase XerD
VDNPFDVSMAGFALAMPTLPGRRKGPSTQKLYLYHVRRLAAWARLRGREEFATITKQELRAYLAALVSRSGDEASTAYKSSVLDGIKCLYVYLEEDEDIPDIAGKLSVGHVLESDRIAHLDAPEVDRLLGACLDERDRAVISVLLDCGLRISELASLDLADTQADLVAMRLLVRGKGSKIRSVPYGPDTARSLRRYVKSRAQSRHAHLPALWLGKGGELHKAGLDALIRRVGARAGIDDIYPHLLRHTWAHHYRLNGGQVDNLVYLAGWSGPAMALRYGRSAAAERAEIEARTISLVGRSGGRRG